MLIVRKLALSIAGFLAFAASTFAEPAGIEFGAIDVATGTFTLQFPAVDKALELYYAEAWADDSLDDYEQWRAPLFVADIPAGTSEVTVTVPEYSVNDTARFFLADPANATVTRPVSVIGGKDSSGHFNSAFVTGLHPNYDWKYDLVFDVPEFASDHQAWLLCHRNSNVNNNSLLHFIVRASDDKRVRFGHGSYHSIYSTPMIEAGVKYQAAIDGRVCVVSNLADNVLFDTLTANTSVQNYGEYCIAGVDNLEKGKYQTAHGGYDQTYANEDPDRVLPVDVMRNLEKEGKIGKLYDYYYATVGNGTGVANAKRFGTEIGQKLKGKVDAVILTST